VFRRGLVSSTVIQRWLREEMACVLRHYVRDVVEENGEYCVFGFEYPF
jgi:hypothetical protein